MRVQDFGSASSLSYLSPLQHGKMHLGVLQNGYNQFFHETPMGTGRSCPLILRARSV